MSREDEAIAILKAIRSSEPLGERIFGDAYCVYCGAGGDDITAVEHKVDCPYRRAVEFMQQIEQVTH